MKQRPIVRRGQIDFDACRDSVSLTVRDLVGILGVSDGTIRRLIWAGELPSHKIGGRVCVLAKEVRAYLRRNGAAL